MEQQIRLADHVLVVCTETYDRRARGDEISGRGRGAIWESLLTYQYLYENAHSNSKIIPIVFTHTDVEHIPQPLRGYQYYDVSGDNGFQLLYRRIADLPLIVPPPLGKPLQLPTATNLADYAEDDAPGNDINAPLAETISASHADRTGVTYDSDDQSPIHIFLNSIPITDNENELIIAFRDALCKLSDDIDNVCVAVNVNCGHSQREALRYALFDDQHVLEENLLTGYPSSEPDQALARAQRLESILTHRELNLDTTHAPAYFHYFHKETIYLGSIALFRNASISPISATTLHQLDLLASLMRIVMHSIVSLHQLSRLASTNFNRILSRVAASAGLSASENRILILMALGHSYEEIANALAISIDTVRKHLKNIYRKTGSRSQSELLGKVVSEINDQIPLAT